MNLDMKLYRQRFIPFETTPLKDDLILYADSDLVVTKWNCLKPRADIARGISAYYLDKGIKVSKVYDSHNNIVYWYCDIIAHRYDKSENSLTVIDLLIDILIYEDGTVNVLDLDELAQCLESGVIDNTLACLSMRNANSLLKQISNNEFQKYKQLINSYDAE